jgi:hypothetical protein
MSESLDEVKRRIARKYLGKAGIHGVGIRRAQNALNVYAKADASPDQQQLLKEIEREAAPYKVIVTQEERPSIT